MLTAMSYSEKIIISLNCAINNVAHLLQSKLTEVSVPEALCCDDVICVDKCLAAATAAAAAADDDGDGDGSGGGVGMSMCARVTLLVSLLSRLYIVYIPATGRVSSTYPT